MPSETSDSIADDTVGGVSPVACDACGIDVATRSLSTSNTRRTRISAG